MINLENEDVQSISGLGRVVAHKIKKHFPTAPKELVAKTVEVFETEYAKSDTATRGQKLLQKYVSQLPAQLRETISRGQHKLIDADVVIRSKTNLAGIEDLLRSVEEKAGVSSFNFGKLKNNSSYLFTRVRLAYGTHATQTNPSSIAYDNIASTIPVQLRNANLIIVVENEEFVNVPVARLLNVGGSYAAVQGNFDCLLLESPILVKNNQVVAIKLDYPDTGLTAPTGNHFAEVRLLGNEVRG